MKIPRGNLLIVTENHGGYYGGMCAVCKSSGWLPHIKHKCWCPLKTSAKEFDVRPVKEKTNGTNG